jgi:hypothetical protein
MSFELYLTIRRIGKMEEFLNGLALMGVPAVVLVPFVVEGMKRLGLPTRWAGVAALGVGLVVAAAIGSVEAWPQVAPWVKYSMAGVLLGLGSAGVYSQVKELRK